MNDGVLHPLIGYGTYKVGYIPPSASSAGGVAASLASDKETKDIFKNALDVGYRFFDCAQFYNNEKVVGEALKESGVPRSELFLASKVWTDNIAAGEEAIRNQFTKTLQDLQTDYLDLYLIHWPVPTKHIQAYKVLESLKQEGKVRSIGLSNYTIEDYEELKPEMRVKPTINQIEVNPFLYRRKTIEYFQKEGIEIQAYRALRQGQQMNHPLLMELSKKYHKTPSQVLGRWCIQKNIIFIPKTVSKERMVQNLDVLGFTLEDSDIALLDALTTESNLVAFGELYKKCVTRDTPIVDGIKTNITIH
uniref:NADP-dependent oxidoreductase domain-containing protein n=1 Tax=Arcella intermedia TaxID=1963864 RepID=A0A6B2LAV9_9EUKA